MYYWISEKKPHCKRKAILGGIRIYEFLILCWEVDDRRKGHQWNRNSSNFCNFLRYEMVSDSMVKKKKEKKKRKKITVRSNFRGKEIRYSWHIEHYDVWTISLQRTSESRIFEKIWISADVVNRAWWSWQSYTAAVNFNSPFIGTLKAIWNSCEASAISAKVALCGRICE